MKIIIAEDNPAILKLYEAVLKKTEHTPVLAANGRQAFQKLEETGARMVITDWEMPEMDGLSLCSLIREGFDSAYIYIIFVTSRDEEQDAVKGLDAGADDYIKKPFQADELIARIRAGERIIQLEDRSRMTYEGLMQAEKMASVGRLAAGMAHEINNPAGYILSNLETMLEYQKEIADCVNAYKHLAFCLENYHGTASGMDQPMQQVKAVCEEVDFDFLIKDGADLLEESRGGIKRIIDLVNDLRSFAHPGENKRVTADLNDGIQTALRVAKQDNTYRETDISISLGKIPGFYCNASHLNQVFYDLIVNALYATREKGKVRVCTKSDENSITIMVSDTGSGIPKSVLSKLFDPFFTTKDVGEGMGLGLNVAYNIVKQHRGRIEVRSEKNRGSVFSVILPLKTEAVGD